MRMGWVGGVGRGGRCVHVGGKCQWQMQMQMQAADG